MSDLSPAKLEYAAALANDLEKRGEVYSAKLVRDLAKVAMPQWYSAAEVSGDIWDGGLWWWNCGDQIFPVSIQFDPVNQKFFAPSGQWGWGRSQDLSEMGGRWTPCREPEGEPQENPSF